jgi:response regulator RpfG family c-di-GMP phosphodiesterase
MNLVFLRHISNHIRPRRSEGKQSKTDKGYESRATALFIFLLISAALNVHLVDHYLTRQKHDGHVVNVAGRQRMLGQKIAYLTHSVATGVEKDRKRLIVAIEAYERALSALKNGGQIMGQLIPPIEPELEELITASERLAVKYLNQARIIARQNLKNPVFYRSLKFIQDNNEELLYRSNDVVDAYVSLKNASQYAHEIDISGRQRMLSQRIAKYAAQIGVSDMAVDREQLLAAINLFSSALLSLKNGGVEKGKPVKPAPPAVAAKLERVEELWRDFKRHSLIVQQHPIHNQRVAKALAFIASNSEIMFENDNRLTTTLADLSHYKVSKLNLLLFVLFGINGFFLMVAYLILRQTGRHLRISREKLREYNERLEEKIEERIREIKAVKEAAILSLAKLAESRDPETGKHLERIQKYTRILAQELMNFDECKGYINEQYVEDITKSSILHDIGKVGIPDRILLKPGKLTKKEFNMIKAHSIIGGKALEAADRQIGKESFLTLAKEIAFFHHEKYDGSGYPKGLKGREIPLSARIVALADTYDAIRSKRPYKEPLSHEFAVREIASQAGRHFDPLVVRAFLNQAAQFERISNEFCSHLPEQMDIHELEEIDAPTISIRPSCPVI